jgi:hypothetical protein
MKRGLIPDDTAMVGTMVRDICYFNAKRYFGFPSPENPRAVSRNAGGAKVKGAASI